MHAGDQEGLRSRERVDEMAMAVGGRSLHQRGLLPGVGPTIATHKESIDRG